MVEGRLDIGSEYMFFATDVPCIILFVFNGGRRHTSHKTMIVSSSVRPYSLVNFKAQMF